MKDAEFAEIVLNSFGIFFQAADIAQGQPPQNAAPDRGFPIETEVNARGVPQTREDGIKLFIQVFGWSRRFRVFVCRDIRVMGEFRQPRGDGFRRQYEINALPRDRRPRHVVETRSGRILRECYASCGLHSFESGCAIGSGPGEYYADRTAAALFSKRFQELIDRQVRTRMNRRPRSDPERLVHYLERGVRGDNVQMVWLNFHAIARLLYVYWANPGQNPRKVAMMRRIEVLNEYERQTGIGGQVPKQKSESFHSSCRRADTDDRNRHV